MAKRDQDLLTGDSRWLSLLKIEPEGPDDCVSLPLGNLLVMTSDWQYGFRDVRSLDLWGVYIPRFSDVWGSTPSLCTGDVRLRWVTGEFRERPHTFPGQQLSDFDCVLRWVHLIAKKVFKTSHHPNSIYESVWRSYQEPGLYIDRLIWDSKVGIPLFM